MTTQTAIYILELYNKWRRGNEDMEMPDPKQLGLAIDLAIECMKGMESFREAMKLNRNI